MTSKLKQIYWWAAVVLIFAACSTNSPIAPTFPSMSTPIAAFTLLPTVTLSHRPTITPASVIASRAPSKPSATPTPSFSVRPIELGENFAETALWSDDGKTIYYAFRQRYSGNKVLNWAAYDVATSATHTISLPVNYDPRIWDWLNMRPPQSGWYPELQGFVSPSGERVVYGVSSGGCSPIATCDPSNPARIEIWRGDVATRKKTKVGEIPRGGEIYQVIWFDNETKVALNIRWATTYSYIADLQTGVITPLEQLANARILESIWSTDVSPDGKILAAINGGELLLINLPDGKAVRIDGPVSYAHWSKDGQILYYETDGIMREFRAYIPTTGLTSTIISQYEYNGPIGSEFAVSPSGDKVAFWGGWLKLVELPK